MLRRFLMSLAIGTGLLSLSSDGQTVLFSDSFDRPDNTDISAVKEGMSGQLAPLSYVEAFEGSGQPSSIQITSGRLHMAVGPGMSNVFVDYNFSGQTFGTANGFAVSLDIVEINSAASDAANRFVGFGLGMTREQAVTAGDINDSATTYRGGSSAEGVCDYFVDVALDGHLRVWQCGTLMRTVALGTGAGTLSVVFVPSGFEAGSEVTATAFFDGVQVDRRSFCWSQSQANYIGLSARASNYAAVDNLTIRTVTQVPPSLEVTQTDGQTLVQEGGVTDQIVLTLAADPQVFPLTVDIEDVLDPNQVTVWPDRVVFNPTDWHAPRPITVTAIDDDAMERAVHDTMLRLSLVAQPDSPYDGYPEITVPVQIMDNDCGSWGFNPADFNLDCQVNLEDFYYFVQEWIACSMPDPRCQDFRY